MSRPVKATVEYFPHVCVHSKTMYIIESRFGNDGYAAWFKLLETLGTSENHFIDCREESDFEYLISKIKIAREVAEEFLNLCSVLGAIDKKLWVKHKIIFSEKFVEGVADAYRRRKIPCPTLTHIYRSCKLKSDSNLVSDDNNSISDGNNPQSKLNKSKEYNYIVEQALDYLNIKTGKHFSKKSKHNRNIIVARINEGFALEDFKKVIDIKCSKWLTDPDMVDFLRPATLFQASKFESYLNEKPKKVSEWM